MPDLDAPFMLPDLVLQVIVQSKYPVSSPVIVPSNPQPWSGDDQAKAVWDKTFQKFDHALRTLTQPISIGQMAEAWDSSAREACHEYAETLGVRFIIMVQGRSIKSYLVCYLMCFRFHVFWDNFSVVCM